MKDKAGAKITVRCRVAEADFGFGDGTVESISVPLVGGGFNVGVKWDDRNKGGPTWFAEGGGRGADHLLVIGEAAPDEDGTGGTGDTFRAEREFEEHDFKGARFKARFNRSPTQSEAEADWDELSEFDGEEGGEEGSEKGGENGGDADAGREAAGGLAAVVKTGVRIKIAMGARGEPCKWYGALVGDERADGFEIGFDDGEVRLFAKAELQDNLAAKCLAAAMEAERGIVANESGHAMAATFVKYKHSSRHGSKSTTIGLLVGNTKSSVAGEPIYQSFHMRPNALCAGEACEM